MWGRHSTAMRILPGIGTALDRPAIAFPFEKVTHGHAVGACGTFRGKGHRGIGFHRGGEDHRGVTRTSMDATFKFDRLDR